MSNGRSAPQVNSRTAAVSREFIALLAALMASTALAIDPMLPALPSIGRELAVPDENDRQFVITIYLLGLGAGQLIYGPLSDRFGRKRLLLIGMALYGTFALLAGAARSFEMLLLARFLQGTAAAATRVLVISIVRDRYQGSNMARIMSMVMVVLMIVPVLAPTFGQAVLAVATWRHIFFLLGAYGIALAIWVLTRLPESLADEKRRPLSASSIVDAIRTTVRIRQSIGNTIAQTFLVGAFYSFLASFQQIIFDVFKRAEMIGIFFACIAGAMALSSYANSRLVVRFGSRKLLLLALSAFTSMALVHLVAAAVIGESLWMFVTLQAATMSFSGLIGANAGALAMEPLGHVAGTASSVQGAITTLGGALIGILIGQQFDGTTLPFLTGLTCCATAALAAALWANCRPGPDLHDPGEVELQQIVSRPG